MTPKEWMEFEKVLDRIADKETLAAVKAAVEGMETNLSGSLTASVVKSIQSGYVQFEDYSTATETVEIAKVDVNKSLVIASAIGKSSSSDGGCIATAFDGESITFQRHGGGKALYYVIEFY